ncbi:MAG: 3-hydroxy-3-methylglutaryl-CoA reductase, partial [Candidatus Saliniplasma sp.]
MSVENSRLSGFHKKELYERVEEVAELVGLSEKEVSSLVEDGLTLESANRMIENVVGTFELPVGIATNFLVNGRDHLVPMVIEESSVVAAASKAAKLARSTGGFYASTTEPVMISQIQVTGISDPWNAKMKVLEKKEEIIELADEQDPVLVEHGGGCRDVRCR